MNKKSRPLIQTFVGRRAVFPSNSSFINSSKITAWSHLFRSSRLQPSVNEVLFIIKVRFISKALKNYEKLKLSQLSAARLLKKVKTRKFYISLYLFYSILQFTSYKLNSYFLFSFLL